MSISILHRSPRRADDRPSDEPLPGAAARAATAFDVQVKERLRQRMVRQCEAMLQHALGTGRVVSAEVMEHLDQAVSTPDVSMTVAAAPRRDDALPADLATGSGSAAERSRLASLVVAHAGLALAIAPATPEAVLLMAEERTRHPFWSGFGPLPLVRRMLGLALLSLVVLLGVSISAQVNTVNMSKSVLELSGFPLLMIEAFLVSAASLGACFANLQRINTFISDGTYDPRVQSTYWTRWVMGVISGIVLSQLVYVFYLAHSGNDPTVGTASVAIGQPILALLGGYSVDFVHGILTRAINSVGNFFGVSMAGGADNQPRPGMVEAVAQQRLALASASVGPERAPASPEIEDSRGRS
jgi:hypothetical protein